MRGAGWTPKLKAALPQILIIVLIRWTVGCSNPQEVTPDGFTVFAVEYDYMTGCNVFTGETAGEEYPLPAFASCKTSLKIVYDEVITTVVYPDFNQNGLLNYVLDHAQASLGPPVDFYYDHYLIGMANAYNKPGEGYFATFAYTMSWTEQEGGDHIRCTAIFNDEIQTNGGSNKPATLKKTVIHELGHNRAALQHLCKLNSSNSGWVQDSLLHNDPGCVMGVGITSLCSSTDLTANPHFCTICCERLKQTK
ncbi:MAG: hypothetical protein AAB305_06305 [Candidatus Zixiibacteriota bacterium]